LGARTFLARPADRAAEADSAGSRSGARRAGWLGAFASTFLLTLTNPMTILSFVAVFAALGLGTTHPEPLSAAGLVLGVFVGSALWWLTLSGAVSLVRSRFDERGLRWVNRVSGSIITAFGIAAIGSLFFRS
ncbi:MAG TPA: LysE family transporter, partial [Candidatus Eisenbacteria bacterium]|nr:LysE family transporter [Candidatus Eisenbacteria bacterium]